jgi:hypothetical protein
MKTPREILFEKHKGAEQKLDAIRASVIAECVRPEPQPTTSVVSALWQELVWPYRSIWAGLSVVWVGIIALWLTEPGTVTRKAVGIAPQMAAAVIVEQRRDLALVLGESEGSQPVPPPQRPLPRPHSARRPNIVGV